MKHKLEEIVEEMSKTWGPLPVRSTSDAVKCFEQAMLHNISDNHARKAACGLFVRGLQEREIFSDGHVSKDDAKAILAKHIELGTTLYVLTPYWSHHRSSDCQGNDGDYCEHQMMPGQLHLFDDFDGIISVAREMLDFAIEGTSNNVTNIRVEIEMIDGDHKFPLGQWEWDKKHARSWWCQTSGGDA